MSANEDNIDLVAPDPTWPGQFAAEAEALRKALRPLEPRMEHFGSTAVPRLSAKPIIDIFIILDDLSIWPTLIQPLAGVGYVYWAENPRTDRMFFVKGMPPHGRRRTHHVHVRKTEDTKTELQFRDRLREHPEDADRYEKLKYELATRFKTDREAYSEAKTEFIRGILAPAGV